MSLVSGYCDLCGDPIPVGQDLCARCADAKAFYDNLTPAEWRAEAAAEVAHEEEQRRLWLAMTGYPSEDAFMRAGGAA